MRAGGEDVDIEVPDLTEYLCWLRSLLFCKYIKRITWYPDLQTEQSPCPFPLNPALLVFCVAHAVGMATAFGIPRCLLSPMPNTVVIPASTWMEVVSDYDGPTHHSVITQISEFTSPDMLDSDS